MLDIPFICPDFPTDLKAEGIKQREKRWRAIAIQNAAASLEACRTARSVLVRLSSGSLEAPAITLTDFDRL